MRYFLDTEFIEKRDSLTLISIGIVSEDEREYYAISNEYEYDQTSDWVKQNVIVPMYKSFESDPNNQSISSFHNIYSFHKAIGKNRDTIAEEIVQFVGNDKNIEFWGYFADYDWVLFCWLWKGGMLGLPKGFPQCCRDVKQLMDFVGVCKLPDPDGIHNSLTDAKWTRDMYNGAINFVKKSIKK